MMREAESIGQSHWANRGSVIKSGTVGIDEPGIGYF